MIIIHPGATDSGVLYGAFIENLHSVAALFTIFTSFCLRVSFQEWAMHLVIVQIVRSTFRQLRDMVVKVICF